MIIFGTKGREEPRGLVAEYCPACCTVRAFVVLDVYEQTHVYWVGMGRGTHRGTSMRCVDCQGLYQFNPARYRQVVSLAQAASLPELVTLTNPALQTQAARCAGCGYTRNEPFRFCPECGVRRG